MLKLSHCWKCQELKDNHKVLNILPADVTDMLGIYDNV